MVFRDCLDTRWRRVEDHLGKALKTAEISVAGQVKSNCKVSACFGDCFHKDGSDYDGKPAIFGTRDADPVDRSGISPRQVNGVTLILPCRKDDPTRIRTRGACRKDRE